MANRPTVLHSIDWVPPSSLFISGDGESKHLYTLTIQSTYWFSNCIDVGSILTAFYAVIFDASSQFVPLYLAHVGNKIAMPIHLNCAIILKKIKSTRACGFTETFVQHNLSCNMAPPLNLCMWLISTFAGETQVYPTNVYNHQQKAARADGEGLGLVDKQRYVHRVK